MVQYGSTLNFYIYFYTDSQLFIVLNVMRSPVLHHFVNSSTFSLINVFFIYTFPSLVNCVNNYEKRRNMKWKFRMILHRKSLTMKIRDAK